MKLLITLIAFFYCFFLTNNSVLAKSLDIPEFNKLWKQAHKLNEEGKRNEANHIFLSIGESFDIDNFNAIDQHKGAYYYWICNASHELRMPGEPVKKKKTRVGYCSKTYNYLKNRAHLKKKIISLSKVIYFYFWQIITWIFLPYQLVMKILG